MTWAFADSYLLLLQAEVASALLESTPHEGRNFHLLFPAMSSTPRAQQLLVQGVLLGLGGFL